jgi:hypothetical protein
MRVISFWIYISYHMGRRGTPCSNLGRLFSNGGTTTLWPAEAARRARSGGSLELVAYGALGLGFQCGFHLWHRGDAVNLSCSPWGDGERRWWLVMVAHLTPLLGWTCSVTKGSSGSKIDGRWRWVLPELMATFNCGENWRRVNLTLV